MDKNEAVIPLVPGAVGCILYGPYLNLPAGNYAVEFKISCDGAETPPGDAAGVIDVCCDFGRSVVAQRSFSIADITRSDGRLSLFFKTEHFAVCEFRVFSAGNATISVQEERLLTASKDLPIIPVKNRNSRTGNASYATSELENYRFILDNMENFQRLQNLGLAIQPSHGGAYVSPRGVVLHLQNHVDFQILTEVFINNDYNFLLNENSCVIDIGMNVGMASLYFATLPNVAEIHAFEPFKPTYNRALKNFALNPTLSRKIKPWNIGLGEAASTATVLYDPAGSIGISTRGLPQGSPETIKIEDAAVVFSEIIRQAKQKGLLMVVKLDCEGSEFPIFDTLGAHGLLREISVFLIEWHKWWSVEKTQADLIDPLLQLGFTVFDQTSAANPHAGRIFAVR